MERSGEERRGAERSGEERGEAKARTGRWQRAAQSAVAALAPERQSEALSGTQWHSVAISGTQWHSVALSGTQWHSVALGGTQWHSVALTCMPQRPAQIASTAHRIQMGMRTAVQGHWPNITPSARRVITTMVR